MKHLASLLLIILSLPLYSQIQFDGLSQCVEYAKQNNPLLKIENLNREVGHEKMRAARAVVLPQVKAFGNIDDNLSLPVQLIPAQFLGGNEGEYAKVKFGTQFTSSYGAEASLSLIHVSNWRNLQSAELGEQIASLQAEDKELSITEQLITAYYFTLLSRESIALAKELVNSCDSLLDAAELRLKNGLIETLEYNRVRSIYLESVQQLRESAGAFEKNLNALKLLSGIDSKDSVVLTENIGSLLLQNNTRPKLTTTAEQLPRYRMLSARNRQAHLDLKKNQSKTLPELSLFARYSRQAFRDEFTFFSSGPWFEVAVAGVRAEWSLFSGFSRHAAIRQATLQKQIAELEFVHYANQATKELDELAINLETATEGVKQYQEHYQLNIKNHAIAGEKYTQGVYSIDQYVNIYQETVRSQNQYLNQLATFLTYQSIVNTRNALK